MLINEHELHEYLELLGSPKGEKFIKKLIQNLIKFPLGCLLAPLRLLTALLLSKPRSRLEAE